MPPAPAHSDDVLVWVIVVLAGLIFVAVTGLVVLLKQRNTVPVNGNGKVKSGELTPETWELKLRQIVREETKPIFDTTHKMRGTIRALASAIESHNREFIDEMCKAAIKSTED